ncbi:YdbH domain-containing protein [Sneathiella sp.]|uniref:intermembrane phospholipid transport protein YdbH family protein n=1 Tax=Sneathiella sp. TaxID=1964365 RepID=UPI0025ED4F2B|nr:YdbH domain-containing protein [Sneathiella sp.]
MALLIVVMLAIALLFRATVLEIAGKAVLHTYGFDEVSLSVRSVGTSNIQIENLSLSDQVSVNDVTVTYRPFSLLSGQIDGIIIEELRLDISNLDQGALKRISEMADGEGTSADKDTTRPYPDVQLQKGMIVAENANYSLSGSFTGNLSSDQRVTVESVFQARVETAAGTILLENTALSVEADIAAQSAVVELSEGMLRHDVDRPDWAPLSLTGSGQLDDGDATVQVALQTSEGKLLAQVEGSYETATGNGNVRASLSRLSFRRDGFQPSDLSRYAANLPLFDGDLNFTVNAEIAGKAVVYQAEIEISSLYVELDGGDVSSERFPIEINGRYLLDDATQDTQITVPELNAILSYAGQEFAVKDLAASLDIVNLAETVKLASLDGTVTHNAANIYFPPLLFSASGKMKDSQEVSISGSVRDETGKFDLNLAAQYQIENGSGNISLHLPPTTIGSQGIMPSRLSSLLKQMDGLSGVINGQAEVTRKNDGNLVLSAVDAELSDGRWQNADIEAEDVTVTVTATQTDASATIQGDIVGKVGSARFRGQGFSIPHMEASFEAEHQNLQAVQSGHLTLSKLTIVPGERALFKETQTVTGTGWIRGNDLNFTFEATTDYLGPYLEITGRHSLSASGGRAQLKVKPISFAKDGLQLGDLVSFDAGVILDGRVTTDAMASWTASGLNSSADVLLENLSVEASGGSVSNMNGKVHIDELFPLSILSPQEISAETAIAGIPLKEPVIRFRVLTNDGDPQLYIDRMALGLVGGTAVINDAVIDTGAETNRIEVQLTSLDLEEVMALSNVEELVATGKVSGRVPLVFGGERLIVDEALLAADGPGVLKMSSEAARRALEGGGDQAMLLLDILENFQYSELSIEIVKTQSGEDTVKLHAEGANPEVENSRPVVLNINLTTSLDKIFNTVLEGYLLSEKALRATVDGR